MMALVVLPPVEKTSCNHRGDILFGKYTEVKMVVLRTLLNREHILIYFSHVAEHG